MYDGIRQLLTADQPKFTKTVAFAGYFLSLRDDSGSIAAARFEPIQIPKLAPYLLILGVLGDGTDFTIRLMGTRLAAEFFGSDLTGKKISEVLGNDESGQRSRYILDQAYLTRKPVLNQPGRARFQDKGYLLLETVTFPLLGDDGAVTKLVTLFDFRVEPDPVPGA